MNEQELTPEQWFKRANDYAASLNFATTGNFEDYRGFYKGGHTPEEMIREEISNCE